MRHLLASLGLLFLALLSFTGSAQACTGSQVLMPGQKLAKGTPLWSCNKTSYLYLDNNGTLYLAEYPSYNIVWSAGTFPTASYATMDQQSGYLMLRDANNNALWWNGGGQVANAYLLVFDSSYNQVGNNTEGDVGTFTNGTNQLVWHTNTSPYLTCTGASSSCTCTGFNPQASGVGAILNACIQGTPNNWTMLLDQNTIYIVDSRVNINHPMTLGVAGLTGDSTNGTKPCYSVPTPGAQQLACPVFLAQPNNNTYGYGGVLLVASLTGGVGADNYTPNTAYMANVHVDHLIVDGNYANRFSGYPIQSSPQIAAQLNVIFNECVNCSFNYGANRNSVGGGLSAVFADGFQAISNLFADHGNDYEPATALNSIPLPRHGECLEIYGSANSVNLMNNLLTGCTDMGLSLDGAVGDVPYPAGLLPIQYGYTGYGFKNANVAYNWIVAGPNALSSGNPQYMQAGMQFSTTNNAVFTATNVSSNLIQCTDTTGHNAACSIGILVGAGTNSGLNNYTTQPDLPTALTSGNQAQGFQVNSNLINGPSVGVVASFTAKADNWLYIYNNTITETDDNANGIQGGFQSAACKQYQNHPNPQDNFCCKLSATTGTWYNTPLTFQNFTQWTCVDKNGTAESCTTQGAVKKYATYQNTLNNNTPNPIDSTPLMIDASVWSVVSPSWSNNTFGFASYPWNNGKGVSNSQTAWAADWRGGFEMACY